MWTIGQLKEAAKTDLSTSYWLSFLVCFVAGLLMGGSGSLNIGFPGFPIAPEGGMSFDSLTLLDITVFIAVFGAVFLFFLITSAISVAVTAFVSNPILVGKCRYFVYMDATGRRFETLFSSFVKGNGYMSVVKAMILRDLFVFLWTLLLIIPGIVKSYSYKMVPYILSEYPNMHWKEALRLSKEMTDGEKWNMFVLDLSFLGWWILGVMAFGIGVIFVQPYYEATWVQFYLMIRYKANRFPVN
ncbi:MAG: DUF975 family protein [Oscillospiraceae bacterium]|nr:DUF975 family protein [Oscillospiraceae bacterium]